MAAWTRVRSLFHNLFRRGRVDAALDAELDGYLQLLADEKVARGLDPAEARRQALLELGGLEQVKDQVRSARAGASLEAVAQDVRYGLRSFARTPGFTAIAILILALGVGVNTAIFSAVDAVLLRPLPVSAPEDLAALQRGDNAGPGAFSYREFTAFARAEQVLSGVAGWAGASRLWLQASGDVEQADGQLVSGSYFEVVGVQPQIGRTFSSAQNAPTAVAVISDGFWRRRFQSDPTVIGRGITLNGQAFTILGVAPAGFTGLDPARPPDVWLPIDALALLEPGWDYRDPREIWLRVTARLREGVGIGEAEAVLRQVDAGVPVRLVPAGRGVTDADARAAAVRLASLLMGGVTSVLLIACANLATLLIARGAARRRELAVRLAIGASRGRLARQLLTESLLLGCAGGAVGLAVASWTIDLVVALAPATAVPPGLAVSLDTRVLLFALGLSVFTGLACGAWPAWQAARIDPKGATGIASRTATSAGVVRRTLVVAQVALSLLMLVGAGLFVRTLAAAAAVDTGYDTDRILLAGVDFSTPEIPPATRPALLDRVRSRIAALPGVEAVSAGQIVPFSGASIGRPIADAAAPPAPGEELLASYTVVTPGYFAALGLPLRGRDFAASDGEGAPRVVIINETLARQLWPGADAVGRRVHLPLREPGPVHEVIGVVADGKYVSLTEPQQPFMYLPIAQSFRPRLTLHVRTAGAPALLGESIRAAVREVDPKLPVFNVQSLDAYVSRSLSRERLLARLLSAMGILALAIAAAGLYGLLAWTVVQRTRELGVRMALGARAADIARLVLADALTLLAAGTVAGLAAAATLSRLVESWLYGVTATDPMTFALAAGLLCLTALAAASAPIRRALRVDPVAALRAD